jgi:hypothetical protein
MGPPSPVGGVVATVDARSVDDGRPVDERLLRRVAPVEVSGEVMRSVAYYCRL